MKRKKKNCKVRTVGLLTLILLCGTSACVHRELNYNNINAETVQSDAGNDAELRETSGNSEAIQNLSAISDDQRGSFTGELAAQLLPEHEKLIRSYMETYYDSLTELRVEDFSFLFPEEASEQVLMNESAVAYLTGLREMQDTDLHLLNYYYEMDVRMINEGAQYTEVQLTETSTQNFAGTPDEDTMLYRIQHLFRFSETNDGWKIIEHWQYDNIYRRLLGNCLGWGDQETEEVDPNHYFPEQVELLLKEAQQEKLKRSEENDRERPTVTHSYQREKAVAYSDMWVGRRNTDWSDFTGRGGNCQNFVSQCLLAGGIPMDDRGDNVWSWSNEEKYSASWVGVDEFYRYVSQNNGYGLQAAADADYYEGEAGDLIRMGNDTDWNHIVIIAEVIRDQEGNVVDYLINSNTSDVKNFPVSAYPTQEQRLMKIYGWNEEIE